MRSMRSWVLRGRRPLRSGRSPGESSPTLKWTDVISDGCSPAPSATTPVPNILAGLGLSRSCMGRGFRFPTAPCFSTSRSSAGPATGIYHRCPQEKPLGQIIESKNNHLVRKYAFTTAMTPPRNAPSGCGSWSTSSIHHPDHPIGYAKAATDASYDAPQTPLDRSLAARVLSAAQQADSTTYRDSSTPAQIGCKIQATCRTDSHLG